MIDNIYTFLAFQTMYKVLTLEKGFKMNLSEFLCICLIHTYKQDKGKDLPLKWLLYFVPKSTMQLNRVLYSSPYFYVKKGIAKYCFLTPLGDKVVEVLNMEAPILTRNLKAFKVDQSKVKATRRKKKKEVSDLIEKLK